MDAVNANSSKTESNTQDKAAAINTMLYIFNWFALVVNGFFLILDGFVGLFVFGIAISTIAQIGLFAFMIVKEFKVKSLAVRALLNIAVFAGFMLCMHLPGPDIFRFMDK